MSKAFKSIFFATVFSHGTGGVQLAAAGSTVDAPDMASKSLCVDDLDELRQRNQELLEQVKELKLLANKSVDGGATLSFMRPRLPHMMSYKQKLQKKFRWMNTYTYLDLFGVAMFYLFRAALIAALVALFCYACFRAADGDYIAIGFWCIWLMACSIFSWQWMARRDSPPEGVYFYVWVCCLAVSGLLAIAGPFAITLHWYFSECEFANYGSQQPK